MTLIAGGLRFGWGTYKLRRRFSDLIRALTGASWNVRPRTKSSAESASSSELKVTNQQSPMSGRIPVVVGQPSPWKMPCTSYDAESSKLHSSIKHYD